MQYFPFSSEELLPVLGEALSRGGDYADIYLEHTSSLHITMQDGVVNRASSNIDYGAGIRVVEGEKSGYAYCEELTIDNLKRAARTASGIVSGSIHASLPLNATPLVVPNRYPIGQSWEQTHIDRIIPYLLQAEQRLREEEPRIVKVQGMVGCKTSRIGFLNSLGESFEDLRPMGVVSLSCIIRDGSRTEQARSSRSFRMGAEMLSESLFITLVEECISKARFALTAGRPKGGVMPVVMAAGASGILLHEAIGHAFEADFIRKNTSIFSDRLGCDICSPLINVVDDATIVGNRGAVNIDDEGVVGQKTYIVREGRLTSFLHDRISARHYGVAPTGNGRRETFRSLPLPRMRATYMEGGNASEADLIASVKRGVYVQDFFNGQVQIGAGDFTFYVKSGYLIEDGRLTAPLKDINIIGNGPQALADIQGVASDSIIDNGTWTCGKEGQSCPVTCGMPAVLVKQLTVGGE